MTMHVFAIFSIAVNSSTTVTKAAYEADPSGSTAAAVAAASKGVGTNTAASSLEFAAGRAAAGTDNLVSGATLTGSPPSTLSSLVAVAVVSALTATGRSSVAALVNATSLATKGSATIGTVLVSNARDIYVTAIAALSAKDNHDAELMAEMIASGGSTSAAFALLTLIVIFFIRRRLLARQKAVKAEAADDIETPPEENMVSNPLQTLSRRRSTSGQDASISGKSNANADTHTVRSTNSVNRTRSSSVVLDSAVTTVRTQIDGQRSRSPQDNRKSRSSSVVLDSGRTQIDGMQRSWSPQDSRKSRSSSISDRQYDRYSPLRLSRVSSSEGLQRSVTKPQHI